MVCRPESQLAGVVQIIFNPDRHGILRETSDRETSDVAWVNAFLPLASMDLNGRILLDRRAVFVAHDPEPFAGPQKIQVAGLP